MASSDIFTKYKCTYCQEEITSLRVRCMECTSFELCLQCFSEGAEIGSHKRDHPYQFVDSVVCDLFRGEQTSWSGRELLYLLHAIERYHYGNWTCISQHIGTKTPEEARNEYNGRFLGGEIGRHTWVPGLRSRWRLTDLTVGREDDPMAMDTLPPGPPKPAVLDDVREEDAKELGYMPLKDFYAEEYDNEAETLISNISWSPDDDELETAMKATLVEMYTQRLRERAKSHRVVRDNQLIQQFFNNKDKPKKKVSREEKELGEKLRPLCKQQEQSVMAGVMQVRRLSRKLAECIRYRRNGLVRLEEIPHFDQERQFRHNAKPGTTTPTMQHFSVGSKKKEKNDGLGEASEMDTAEPLASAHLLSSTETHLCTAMDMTPTQFISVKALMLVDPLMKVDGECGQHILDHLVSSGWVSSVTNPS